MAEKNFEDLLRELKSGSLDSDSQSDLIQKIKNVIRKLKTEMESRVIEGDLSELVFDYMKEEGIVNENALNEYGLTSPILKIFGEKFKYNSRNGLKSHYNFFDSTSVPEDIRKDIEAYKEIWSQVDFYMDSYVKEHGAKPSPQEFKDFIYSRFPEDLVIEADSIAGFFGYNSVNNLYFLMRCRYKMGAPTTEKEKLTDEIKSKIEEIDLDDI